MAKTQITSAQIKDTDIATTDVADGAITLAKMANMATASVIYRKTAATGVPEVQTLATLKTDLGLTGTNSGNQTSIVGITGTMAQFDTAVTDGNLLYTINIDDTAYDATSWNGDTTHAPSKNAVRDKIETMLSSSGMTWAVVTADATMAVNNGYIANKATLLTMALPTTSAVGSVCRISGMNAGLWKISQAASQKINFGDVSTTAGVTGYLASVLTRDGIELVCVVADLEWNVVSSIGNITVV